jgi:signal transduction histidine kinase
MWLTYKPIYPLLCCWVLFLFSGMKKSTAQFLADSLAATIQQIDTAGTSSYLKDEIESLSRMLEDNPSDSLVLTRLNDAIYTIGTEGDAVRALNDLLERLCKAKIAEGADMDKQQYYKLFYANALNTEAEFLHQEDKTEEKLALRFEALEIAKEIKDTSLIVEILQNFGIDYFNNANYVEADKYYTQAVELEVLRNNPKRLLQAKVRRADVLIMLGKLQEAIEINEEFLKMVTEEKDEISMLNTQYSLGVAYKKQGNLDKASFYLKQAKNGMEAYDYLAGVGQILKELALIAEAEKDWDTMYGYGREIQEIAEKTGYPQMEKNAAQILYMAYSQRGEYQKSLEEYRKFIALRDSITGRERTRQMLEQQHTFELKQDSIQDAAELAIEVESRKRSQNTALASWVILALILVFVAVLWNRYRFIQKQKKQLDLANEELKQLDKAKSRFFANISHELRTPLTVISGMTNLLEESETRSLIKNNSGKLLTLVNQILDLSKLQANKLHFNLKQDDIIRWLRYLVESFQSYAESKAIELEFSTEEERLVMDYDQERVSSIVTNLLSNAIKFTPKGGEVSLAASREGKFLLIRVQDNGIGIPHHSKEHIFDRFYQVDDGNTRHGDGTGIGLALTKDLVVAFGGNISVESSEEKGSVFSARIPIKNESPVVGQAEELSLLLPRSDLNFLKTVFH